MNIPGELFQQIYETTTIEGKKGIEAFFEDVAGKYGARMEDVKTLVFALGLDGALHELSHRARRSLFERMAENREDYDNWLETMKGYLFKEGKILPFDVDDFLYWFYGVENRGIHRIDFVFQFTKRQLSKFTQDEIFELTKQEFSKLSENEQAEYLKRPYPIPREIKQEDFLKFSEWKLAIIQGGKESLDNLKSAEQAPPTNDKSKPVNTFDECFKAPEHLDKTLEVLRALDKISEGNRWLGKQNELGVLADVLKSRAYFKEDAPKADKDLVPLIAQHFGTTIKERTARTRPVTNDFRDKLRQELPKVS